MPLEEALISINSLHTDSEPAEWVEGLLSSYRYTLEKI